jgi:hypothetical protein
LYRKIRSKALPEVAVFKVVLYRLSYSSGCIPELSSWFMPFTAITSDPAFMLVS